MNYFTLVFLVAVTLSVGVQWWLAQRQRAHVKGHRDQVPSAFAEKISLQAHRRAADYTVAKASLEMVEVGVSAALLLLFTLGGGLELIDALWRGLGAGPLLTGVGVLLTVFLALGLLELPITAYRVFGLEQRFDFNRTTPALFIADALKHGLLLILIGGPLALLILWLVEVSGPRWWLLAWLVWMGMVLLLTWAYPMFIAPLFNAFNPLENGALHERILRLLQRTGFRSNGIYVMDGSRRSAHGNAYFAGLGSQKRIVFFDTLLRKLPPDEIEAVLAHELGHFKHRHVHTRMGVMALSSLVGLALLGWLVNQGWFYAGLGVQTPSSYNALALFLLILPAFSIFLQPFTAYALRRHEFEADRFAARQVAPQALIAGLVKLYEDNAATLTPDPLYSAFHDSHPPAPVRIAHLQTYSAGSSEARAY